MSEIKSLEQLQAEYSNLCAQAGHIGFNIYLASKDLAAVQDKIAALNATAIEMKKAAETAEVKASE